jgi:hypothetical protein
MSENDSAKGSAFGRMFNVLAAPGEVFSEIKDREVEHSNWLVPALVAAVIMVSVVLILFSQESFMREMMKMQSKAMDQQVSQGKITREQADQFEKASQGWMPMAMKIGGSITMLMYAFGVPFFWGFLIWLLGTKVFKADFEYMKGVEAAGLASVIYTLAALLGSLVSLSLNKMISLTPAYFMGEVDPTNKTYLAMAALNPFYIWFVVVVAVSISVLAGVSLKKPLMWLLALWVLHRAILIAIGMGQFVM